MNEYIKEIPGWMGDPELEYLHKLVKESPPDAIIVELGTWMGRSTGALYTALHHAQRVITVDTWLGQEDLRFEAHKEVLEKDVFLEFMKHMKKLNIEPQWYTIGKRGALYLRMFADDASTLFHDNTLYRVIVDSDHRFVGHDIDKWSPKLRSDGKFCGHDWNWKGVKKQIKQRLKVDKVIGDLWVGS